MAPRWRLRTEALALAAVLVVLLATPKVLAEESASYTSSGRNDVGEVAAATARTSPSMCEQNAEHPHKSKHFGDMAGHVTAECQLGPVPRMRHTAQLWETRFWGWDRIGEKGTFDDTFVEEGRATGSDRCRKNLIRVTGDGEITDKDGRTYVAATESRRIDNPCGL